jgi:Leucine-rich repeat (LRR) protein
MPISVRYNEKYQESFSDISEITDLFNVTTLNMNSLNLGKLPDNLLERFPNLLNFSCDSCNLTEIPEFINASKLISISFNNNLITHVSDKIFNCEFMPNICIIHLSNNKIIELPKTVNLPKLTHLYIDNNKLTHLPDHMTLPNLEFFDCSNNQITQLPVNMHLPRIVSFDCYNNNITTLPTYILEWTKLQAICYYKLNMDVKLRMFLNNKTDMGYVKLNY